MQLPRIVRLPSFAVAYAGSVATLVAFAGWAFLDFAFCHLVVFWHGTWDQLGSRQVVFIALGVVAVAMTASVLLRLFVGEVHSRSLKGHLLAVTLVGAWLGLVLAHERISWTGFVWRVQRMLPGLKQDANVLSAQWPTENGELPYLGRYHVFHPHVPHLYLEDWTPERRLTLLGGPFVYLVQDGIRFDLDFSRWVEYRPDRNGSPPLDASGEAELYLPYRMKSIKLERNWFLVWQEAPNERPR